MLRALRPAILVSVIFLVLLGLAYPLAETGIGQLTALQKQALALEKIDG